MKDILKINCKRNELKLFCIGKNEDKKDRPLLMEFKSMTQKKSNDVIFVKVSKCK